MSSSYCKQVRLHVWSFIWSKDLDQLPFFTLEFYNSDVSQPAFSIRFTVRYCCFSATFCPHWNEWWNSQVMSSCPCHGLHDIFPRESIEPRSLLSHSHSHSLYTYHGPPGPTIPTPGTALRFYMVVNLIQHPLPPFPNTRAHLFTHSLSWLRQTKLAQ